MESRFYMDMGFQRSAAPFPGTLHNVIVLVYKGTPIIEHFHIFQMSMQDMRV